MLRTRRKLARDAIRLAFASALARRMTGNLAGAAPDGHSPGNTSESNHLLLNLMTYAPLESVDLSLGMMGYFADAGLQLRTAGIAPPHSLDADDESIPLWVSATRSLIYPALAASAGLNPIFRDVVGWDQTQIDSSFEAGTPPLTTIILRGRFDLDEIRLAQRENGYQTIDLDGSEVASLHAEATLDLESPVSRLALARTNNSAVLDGNTLVYTASLDLMRQVIAASGGAKPSFASVPMISALVNSIDEPLASAMLVTGAEMAADPATAIPGTSDVDDFAAAIANQQLHGPMPPAIFALFGITAGGPIKDFKGNDLAGADLPPARMKIAVYYLSPEAAAEAGNMAEERLRTTSTLATRKSFSELFASWETKVVADQPILLMTLTPLDNPALWYQLVMRRDIGFLAW